MAMVLWLNLVCCQTARVPGAVSEWLLWGPYSGKAGLSAIAPDLEARIRPAHGDTTEAAGCGYVTKGQWLAHRSADGRVDFNLISTFGRRPGIFAWAGGCAYAHSYLHVAEAQRVRVRLTGQWRVRAWLNGAPAAGVTELRRGWNRLMVKVALAPAWLNVPDWWFAVRVTTPDGAPVPGLTAALSDPDRDPAETGKSRAGMASRVKVSLRSPGRWAPLFIASESVQLRIEVGLTAGNGRVHRRRLAYAVTDCDGRPVRSGECDVSFSSNKPANVPLRLGRLPLGYYQIVGALRHDPGVTCYLPAMSFVVLRGPVHTAHDDAPRKLAGCDHWLMNSRTARERVWWLHQVGLTLNVGSCASWWATYQNGRLSTEYRPYADDALDEAHRLGVCLTGYLEGGWPVAALQPQPRKHWLREGLVADRLVVWPWMPLPEFSTRDYARVVRQYAFRTVQRYRNRTAIWKSYNEIDIAGHMPPGQYAHIARILYEETKRADPDAAMIGASFAYPQKEWVKELFRSTDFARWHDVYDIHAHAQDPPDIGGNIGGSMEGLSGLRPLVTEAAPAKPVWYGEVSPPLSHAAGGQWEQASNVVKQAAFAAAEPQVQVLAWLIPYGGGVPDISTSSVGHMPFPSVVAISLCNHLLDGRAVRPLLSLPPEVQHVRVTAAKGETLVLWSGTEQVVAISAQGERVTVTDPVGRERSLPVTRGVLRLSVGRTPAFVRGDGFGDR